MKYLNQIFDKLNFSEENGLFIFKENKWKGIFTNRVERLLKNKIKPDAFFVIDKKPFVLFFDSLNDKKQKLKEIWNFNESPIVIINQIDSVEIYNGFEFITKEESLRVFGNEELLSDFSYFELVTGKTWEKYQKDFNYNNRVDYFLLNNIKSVRNVLLENGLTVEIANSLLGKALFVRYLIDRKVKLDFENDGTSREWTNIEFCDLLLNKSRVKSFFKYLKKKFGGDLFPISDLEFENISEYVFKIVANLLLGNNTSTGQLSLFNFYDFSIIPVEFISNVYELFIGQKKQEKEGAYYTPLFLVDYILAETVEKKFRKHSNLYNCKVLDPSCGSGIFLVETLRKIIERYRSKNANFLEKPEEYKHKLKQLASDNIFGIDKDQSAVNVAIFSIYLTLLDYQEPSDIETFKFPTLYNKNLFSNDFFNVKADFNISLKNISFDFILGNPPWKRGNRENSYFSNYIKERNTLENGKYLNDICISNGEIAQAFILRVSDFSRECTNVSFIATSKVLYNLNAVGFRKYFLDQFIIKKVFELAPVRKEIFDKSNDKAIAPAAILFYKYAFSQNTDDNSVEHITLKPSRFFSLFKVFTIHRGDYKIVSQANLKKYDYLWKILVFGTYLDFNFIQRLKNSYHSINDIISNTEKFAFGQGMQLSGGNKMDVSYRIGHKFIDAKKDIKDFWVNLETEKVWKLNYVHRSRKDEIFKAPLLLILKGFKSNFRCWSAYSDEDVLFQDALTSISVLKKGNIDTIKIISGILYSELFAYLNLHTFSSSGIEREQAHNKEKFSIPFVPDKKILEIVDRLINLKKKKYSLVNFIFDEQLKNRITQLEKRLDNQVAKAFSLYQSEKSLLNYSNSITIPILMKLPGYEKLFKPLDPNSSELQTYINLFLERFNNKFENSNQKLIVEIHHTTQLIGLFFKLTMVKNQFEPIKLLVTESDKVLKIIANLGNEKITDRLFIQKDIRGFEKNGFYIVKPNEKRLWHKAIAYLDLNEFTDAILNAGKKQEFNVW